MNTEFSQKLDRLKQVKESRVPPQAGKNKPERCQDCQHAKRWLVCGGVSVECLAKQERGYVLDRARNCDWFEAEGAD